ncbi:unnamed protein product, partial [Brenthis ino]
MSCRRRSPSSPGLRFHPLLGVDFYTLVRVQRSLPCCVVSPYGASDDAAGCAVALETLRALAAAPRPLRHDVLVLLNGAEENILQASHAFVTRHPWARTARAFINIEACGAGGREVLFQAGPHDPWIVEVYAAAVPHPFASSLAQELFESGLIPADTDFRIFRDYGNLSGVDLAWSSNGYVYHTRLDTAERVPPAVLQRTGDNVLALARGLLAGERLRAATERARQPVFFDVLGACVVAARAPAAALAALLAALAVAAALARSACDATRELHVGVRVWGGAVGRAAVGAALAAGAGAAASAAAALALHAAGARLSFYARPWLLLPLYALPALVGAWVAARYLWRRWATQSGVVALARGWWAWRAWRDGQLLCALLLLMTGTALRLRSAFLPALWTLPALGVWARRRSDGKSAALGAALAALPALQSAYLALGSINMFVPMMGRAGTAPLPPDVLMALVVSQLTLLTCSWALPLVVAARRPAPLLRAGVALAALAAVLVLATPLGAPYSAERPQRFMVFHTRRSVHAASAAAAAALDTDASNATHEDFYWIPELDVNTPHSMDPYVPEMRAAQATLAAECERWPYCGAPYFLPVLSLVARGHRLPAPAPPLAVLRLAARLLPAGDGDGGARTLELELREAPAHVVLVLAPAPGARVAHCEGLGAPQEGPRWGARRTYFVALHQARRPRAWRLACRLAAPPGAAPARWLRVAAAGHAMAGAARRAPTHARLLAALPPHAAATGWGVHLHVFEL